MSAGTETHHLWWVHGSGMVFEFVGPRPIEDWLMPHFDETLHSVCPGRVDCTVTVHPRAARRQIALDRRYPAATYERTLCGSGLSVMHLEYGTLARTLTRLRPGRYNVETYIDGDERAVLLCVRDHLFRAGVLPMVVHGALLRLGGRGTLLVGPSGCGKTSALVALCQCYDGCLIADEEVALTTEGPIVGSYLPRVFGVPLMQVARSCLRPLLSDLKSARASQTYDVGWLQRVIAQRRFHARAHVSIARAVVAELCGCDTAPSATIAHIVFPHIVPDADTLKRRLVSTEEAATRMEWWEASHSVALELKDMRHRSGMENRSWLDAIIKEDITASSVGTLCEGLHE